MSKSFREPLQFGRSGLPMTKMIIVDGPDCAPATLILAHGAGAGMDTDFMNAFAVGLADQGLRVVRFEFPYMAERRQTGKRRPPDRGHPRGRL